MFQVIDTLGNVSEDDTTKTETEFDIESLEILHSSENVMPQNHASENSVTLVKNNQQIDAATPLHGEKEPILDLPDLLNSPNASIVEECDISAVTSIGVDLSSANVLPSPSDTDFTAPNVDVTEFARNTEEDFSAQAADFQSSDIGQPSIMRDSDLVNLDIVQRDNVIPVVNTQVAVMEQPNKKQDLVINSRKNIDTSAIQNLQTS